LGEKYKTDFTDIAMLTRGVELCRKECNTSVMTIMKKYFAIKMTDFVNLMFIGQCIIVIVEE